MPIYEYCCEACNEPIEVFQRMSDPSPSCPACGGENVRRVLSRSSFVLKGGGWYKDGYASKAESPAKAGDKKGGESTDKPGKGETQKDSSAKEKKTGSTASSSSSSSSSSSASGG